MKVRKKDTNDIRYTINYALRMLSADGERKPFPILKTLEFLAPSQTCYGETCGNITKR